MHNHGKDKGSLWVKWGMLLHCGLPILILLFLGFSGVKIGIGTWILLGLTILVVNIIMRRSHY
jgi:hypothetical protein